MTLYFPNFFTFLVSLLLQPLSSSLFRSVFFFLSVCLGPCFFEIASCLKLSYTSKTILNAHSLLSYNLIIRHQPRPNQASIDLLLQVSRDGLITIGWSIAMSWLLQVNYYGLGALGWLIAICWLLQVSHYGLVVIDWAIILIGCYQLMVVDWLVILVNRYRLVVIDQLITLISYYKLVIMD